MEKQKTSNGQSNHEGENKEKGIAIPDFIVHYRAIQQGSDTKSDV